MPTIKQCKSCYKPMAKDPKNERVKQKFIRYGGKEVGMEFCETCYEKITKGD